MFRTPEPYTIVQEDLEVDGQLIENALIIGIPNYLFKDKK